jgi:hypothetical protein
MSKLAKTLQAAAGNAGGDNLYVEDVFSTYLYTGNGSTQTITNGIDLDGEGGLVWAKPRSIVANNTLYDTARGVSKALISNSTASEQDYSGNGVTSFNSNGFAVTDAGPYAINDTGTTYASWTFRKAPKFFDVVTYTGNGLTGARQISHNLGSVPGCVIIKRFDSAATWSVWHRKGDYDPSEHRHGFLDQTADFNNYGDFYNNVDQSTYFTDSYFTVRNGGTRVNASGGTYVAYLFAHNAGGFGDDGEQNVISCGSYTGNGSATGPVIDLGYEPQWLLIKRTDNARAWYLLDNMRGLATGSSGDVFFEIDTSAAESSSSNAYVGLTPTGFSLETTAAGFNASGGTYIYIAIRRGPMKTPESGTEVFAIGQGDGDSDVPDYISNFPVDTAITKRTSAGNNGRMSSRLTGANYLSPNLTQAESADSAATFDFMNGWGSDGANRNTDEYAWMFRRAPSVFDVVCYTGTGVAGHVVNHNLGVAPEWIITKKRTSTGFQDWYTVSSVYYNTIPYDRQSALTMPNGFTGGGYISGADSTSFTLSTIYIGNEAGAPIITYLFASAPNVSKVGTYTGTGSDVNVDCGFSSGARFVYVQRADATGTGKYIWDSVRGIVSGNDPYLLINSTAAEEPNTDYIDPLASGFTVTSNASSTINISGAIYFFLAIA